MIEIWKEIRGYEDLYMVSNLGRVASNDRFVEDKNGVKRYKEGKIIKQCKNKGGYKQVFLSKNNIKNTVRVHRLVADAFLCNLNDKKDFVVDHIDGDKNNNKISNLQIITQRENIIKSIGKDGKTSKHIGVFYDKSRNRYRAYIRHGKKVKYFGTYICEEEAKLAYEKGIKELGL